MSDSDPGSSALFVSEPSSSKALIVCVRTYLILRFFLVFLLLCALRGSLFCVSRSRTRATITPLPFCLVSIPSHRLRLTPCRLPLRPSFEKIPPHRIRSAEIRGRQLEKESG